MVSASRRQWAPHTEWWAVEGGHVQNTAVWGCGSDLLVSQLSRGGHSLNPLQ